MRPHTLPPSYWKFISRTGPIHPVALKAVRRTVRGKAIDLAEVNQYISSRGGTHYLSSSHLEQVSVDQIMSQSAVNLFGLKCWLV